MLAAGFAPPPPPQQQVVQNNAFAYAAIQTQNAHRPVPQRTPTFRQPDPTQAPNGWENLFGIGVSGASTQPTPPATVEDVLYKCEYNFEIKKSAEFGLKESLQGHVIAVGIRGMGRAYRAEPLIEMLDFTRGDLVLVEGFDKHCDDWVAYGIPKANCMPLDTGNPELAERIMKAEATLLDEIRSTAGVIYDCLPANFLNSRYGYRPELSGQHVDRLLEFIDTYEDSVTRDKRDIVKKKIGLMEQAGAQYTAIKEEAAIARQEVHAQKAAFYKSSDRAVLIMLDADNVAALAPQLYQQNDMAMIDRDALHAMSKPFPNPPKKRTEL